MTVSKKAGALGSASSYAALSIIELILIYFSLEVFPQEGAARLEAYTREIRPFSPPSFLPCIHALLRVVVALVGHAFPQVFVADRIREAAPLVLFVVPY